MRIQKLYKADFELVYDRQLQLKRSIIYIQKKSNVSQKSTDKKYEIQPDLSDDQNI
jgi:hypothetical protein